MRAADGGIDLQGFLERLAIQLTSWQATTFLVGEYPETDVAENAIFRCQRRPVAVPAHRPQLWPAQAPGDENARTGSAARATHPAHHAGWSARIPEDHPTYGGGRPAPKNVCRPGVAALDEMLGGGILAWDSLLVTG